MGGVVVAAELLSYAEGYLSIFAEELEEHGAADEIGLARRRAPRLRTAVGLP